MFGRILGIFILLAFFAPGFKATSLKEVEDMVNELNVFILQIKKEISTFTPDVLDNKLKEVFKPINADEQIKLLENKIEQITVDKNISLVTGIICLANQQDDILDFNKTAASGVEDNIKTIEPQKKELIKKIDKIYSNGNLVIFDVTQGTIKCSNDFSSNATQLVDCLKQLAQAVNEQKNVLLADIPLVQKEEHKLLDDLSKSVSQIQEDLQQIENKILTDFENCTTDYD